MEEQEVKEAMLGYWSLLIALPYHKSMKDLVGARLQVQSVVVQ
jgi:hypothetical protein